jgi:hypothetical protein
VGSLFFISVLPALLPADVFMVTLPVAMRASPLFSVQLGTVPAPFFISIFRVWFRCLLHPALLLIDATSKRES